MTNLEGQSPSTARSLQAATARYMRINLEQLRTHRRPPGSDARAVAMYLVRTVLGHSYPQVGSEFDRDHTSVYSAVKKVKGTPKLLATAESVRLEFEGRMAEFCATCGQRTDRSAVLAELRIEQSRLAARIATLEDT